jgi:hypothetical protein
MLCIYIYIAKDEQSFEKAFQISHPNFKYIFVFQLFFKILTSIWQQRDDIKEGGRDDA